METDRTDRRRFRGTPDRGDAHVRRDARPDIVLVPGGPGCAPAARDDVVLDWLREVSPSASWTTSVCTGSVVLAAAGLLDGKRATSHWIALAGLKAFGVTAVSDERIVRAGNIVTAAGVSAGIDLALWLAGEIAGEAKAKAVQLLVEYDPQPPFDSGHSSKASVATKASATAMMTSDVVKSGRVMSAGARLVWDRAVAKVRSA